MSQKGRARGKASQDEEGLSYGEKNSELVSIAVEVESGMSDRGRAVERAAEGLCKIDLHGPDFEDKKTDWRTPQKKYALGIWVTEDENGVVFSSHFDSSTAVIRLAKWEEMVGIVAKEKGCHCRPADTGTHDFARTLQSLRVKNTMVTAAQLKTGESWPTLVLMKGGEMMIDWDVPTIRVIESKTKNVCPLSVCRC